MTALSDTLEDRVINWLRGTAFPAAPSGIFLALFTTVATDTGGTEVTGGAYARQSITLAVPSPSGVTSNTNLITFPAATAAWGTILSVGIFDAVTAGTLLWRGPESAPNPTVDVGETLSFAIGDLDITLD